MMLMQMGNKSIEKNNMSVRLLVVILGDIRNFNSLLSAFHHSLLKLEKSLLLNYQNALASYRIEIGQLELTLGEYE